jgi:hypothetical protein
LTSKLETWDLKTKFLHHPIGGSRRDLKRMNKNFSKIPLKPRQVLPMNGGRGAAVAGAELEKPAVTAPARQII